MLKKSVKSTKALIKIENETQIGEAALAGAAYGESLFSDESLLNDIMEKMNSPMGDTQNA